MRETRGQDILSVWRVWCARVGMCGYVVVCERATYGVWCDVWWCVVCVHACAWLRGCVRACDVLCVVYGGVWYVCMCGCVRGCVRAVCDVMYGGGSVCVCMYVCVCDLGEKG